MTGATGATGALPVYRIKHAQVFETPGTHTFKWPHPSVSVVFATLVGAGGGGGGAAYITNIAAAGGGGGATGGAVVRYPLYNDGTNPTLDVFVGAGGSGGAFVMTPDVTNPIVASSGADGQDCIVTMPTNVKIIGPGGGGGSGGAVDPTADPVTAVGGEGGPGYRPAWQPDTYRRLPLIGTGVLSTVGDPGGAGAIINAFTTVPAQPGLCGPYAPILSGMSDGFPSMLPNMCQSYGKTSSSGGGGGAYFNSLNAALPGAYGGPSSMPFVGYPVHADPPNPGTLADGGGGGDMLNLPPFVDNGHGGGGHGGSVDVDIARNGQTGDTGIVVIEWM